jgi:hypothetical protein
MKIDTIMHFTDEIGTVEISTFRDELVLVVPPDLQVQLVVNVEDRSYIHITKKEIR